MIEVHELTKKYAGVTAIDRLSFKVDPGEVVGFLGPNGAGKSTTMRILSGYMPSSAGTASVAGHDVLLDSVEVRRRIGYLPENCPLYLDMRVDEYLFYRAALKGVSLRQRKARVREVKSCFGLEDAGRRIIGNLSKGYRQRVGLADALVHDPELLILDEPTIGLDPNQIREVRSLIKGLSPKHTLLISTHILSEVDMTCSRVIIINEGRIMASDTPAGLRNLLSHGGCVWVEVEGDAELISKTLAEISGVTKVEAEQEEEWCRVMMQCAKDADVRQDVYRMAVNRGWRLRELRLEQGTLEDVFVKLTQTDQEES